MCPEGGAFRPRAPGAACFPVLAQRAPRPAWCCSPHAGRQDDPSAPLPSCRVSAQGSKRGFPWQEGPILDRS